MITLPNSVLRVAAGSCVVHDITEEVICGSMGAATAEVVRVSGRVLLHGGIRPFSLIRKTVRPLASRRHAVASELPGHWAYWRREPLAYGAKVLPEGPGLRAPRCYGVTQDTIYLEDVVGVPEDPERAAHCLGHWQSAATAPAVPWLAGHQLEQRIAVTQLDWSSVDADSRAVEIWNARYALLNQLTDVPRVLSHGDYNLENLVAQGKDTVVFDWGTMGLSPVGSDLAQLALSSLTDLFTCYFDAMRGICSEDDMLPGYQTTLALTGASRLHWMLANNVEVPDDYVDFVWESRPRLRHS